MASGRLWLVMALAACLLLTETATASRYISYRALGRDNCMDYKRCPQMRPANPYSRGCTYVTHCARMIG